MVPLAAFFLIFSATPVKAAQEELRVTATILVASNKGHDFNLVNDQYRDELIKLFSYSAYSQIDAQVLSLTKAGRQKLALPEGYELMLTLQGTEKSRVLVQAVIRKENRQYLDTVLSILRPGVVFVGGPPVSEGEIIIVLETGF
jgi:hypothetical protein